MPEPTVDQLRACVAEVKRVRAMGGHITQAEIDGALRLLTTEPPSEPTPDPDPPVDPPAPEPEPEPTPEPPPPSDDDTHPGGGWPSPATTGVPVGTTLTDSGSLVITTPGAVIDALHVRGTVKVQADNVTIRRSIIDSTGTYPVQLMGDAKGLVIEDSEIDGGGKASAAILKRGYTLRRVEIRNVKDGPRIEGDDVTIEDCLIWKLTRVEGGHHDTIQIRKGIGITIRHNTLLPYRADTDDPMNAAIQIGSALGDVPISGLVVEGNYMDGGNYTINGGSSWVTEAVYRGNTFGEHFRYGVKKSVAGGSRWDGSNRMANGTPV